MIKLTKKELKTPDQIWQTSRSLMTWATDRFAMILIFIGLTFVGVIGGVYFYQAKQRTEGKAQYHYSLAKTQFQQIQLVNGPGKEAKDITVNEGDVKKELEILNSQFKSSYANKLADQIRAELSLQKKNYSEAATFFESYANALPRNDKDFAYYPLAQTYEQSKDFTKALETYEKILSRKDSVYTPLALLGKARALKNLNKITEAKQTFESFIEKFPDSPEISTVRGLLALAQEETPKK